MAFDLNAFLQQMQQQYQQSNQAGLEQYGNLMRGINDMGGRIASTYDRAAQGLVGMGDTERARIGEGMTQNLAASEQDLMSRGLGNTTVRDTTRRGIRSDADRSMADVAERVAGARSNLEMNRANSQLQVGRTWADAVLSRQNQGPDLSSMMGLIQNLAASGGMGGGSGGGGGGGHSYNFGGVNRTPGPPGGQGFFGSVGGGGGGTGVQTFTNAPAGGGDGGWRNTGWSASGMSPSVSGNEYVKRNGTWWGRRVMRQSSTGPVSYSGVTP